jgi:hypothetical protein
LCCHGAGANTLGTGLFFIHVKHGIDNNTGIIMPKINIISISDIHIGHVKTAPSVIHENLKHYLYPELNQDADILIISGDFFDTLLDMNGDAGYHAAMVIEEIKTLCKENNILIRVLRGTFTHDRHQNRFFKIDVDQVRIDTISVEWIESLGISILYVPDDLPYDNPLEIIKEKMVESQIGKVDIASMHCYFDHLLPKEIPRKPHNCYNSDDIVKLVHGPILNGHVHKSNVYKNVITNGSFDRTAHGEEENKGFFKVVYDTDTKHTSFSFVINRKATVYKTITVGGRGISLDDFPKVISDILNNDVSSSGRIYLRVASEDKAVLESTQRYIRDNHDNIVFSAKSLTDEPERNVVDHLPTIAELPSITKDTLPSMIVAFAKDKLNKTITEQMVLEELK